MTLGEGPPLLLVAVSGYSMEACWKRPETLARLDVLGRTLVTFDFRGMGASQRDVDDLSMQARVQDVSAVADQVGLRRFDMWGTFEGAAICVSFASQYADRVASLILDCPFESGAGQGPTFRALADLTRANPLLASRTFADIVFPQGPTEDHR